MNFDQLLNGVLKSVGNTANQTQSDLGGLLNSVLGAAKNSAAEIKSGNTDTITKVGGGAAVVGLLSMILGRNGGASLTKLGSLAALGSLAYKAYQDYQRNQSTSATALSEQAFEENHTEAQSMVILRTMIASALADGELDEQEKSLILKEAGNDPALQQWILEEVNQPITIDEIAKIVGKNTALAAQVYLAARMVCQELSRKEIVFLSQLATALHLDDALVEQLEKQAGF